jgi:large subunit ribosomal protein L40
MMDRLLCSQQKALEELRAESEELYLAAIQMDYSYIPCEIQGPVDTPPIKDYDPTEGDYIDISKKWD